MKKYSVDFVVYASVAVVVEAESEEEAREKAEAEVTEPTLCHQCSDEVEICSIGDITSVSEIEE
jgi:hypothetical protein